MTHGPRVLLLHQEADAKQEKTLRVVRTNDARHLADFTADEVKDFKNNQFPEVQLGVLSAIRATTRKPTSFNRGPKLEFFLPTLMLLFGHWNRMVTDQTTSMRALISRSLVGKSKYHQC
eukprot:4265590-Amphidinium_carterae.1